MALSVGKIFLLGVVVFVLAAPVWVREWVPFLSVPLEWFTRLRNATSEQRSKWRFIARGIGIHWEEIDEDIAVTTLLRV